MKRWAPLVLTAFLVACDVSSTGSSRSQGPAPAASETRSSATTRQEPEITTLPRRCARWRGAPSGAEITFSSRGRLFALEQATGAVRCLARETVIEMEWGPRGDRLLMTSPQAAALGRGFVRRFPGDNRYETWSRPSGTSVIYISHDFKRLLKEDVSTGEVTDVSFLVQHLDVAYHPAGTHIAVAGETPDGRAGLYLATNEGTEIQQIVRRHKARQVGELGFSHDGRRLYFQATHGKRIDLHSVRIRTGRETADTERALSADAVETIFSGDKAPYYALSPFGRRPRMLYGPCVPGEARIRVGGRETKLDEALGAVDPIAWLPDDSVVFIGHPGRCDDFGEGDLYTWKEGRTTLLVEDVDGAAVRARLPKAPDPPARAQDVVA